ncbi:MAG: glycosyltransferase [Chitinophagaceae bacterium]|nr:glycosyltransferase [Chitinophagaceae bacterium]
MDPKKKILYIHHDLGNSGASRSLSFLLDKLNTEKFTAKVHCIFNGPVLELFKHKPVELILRRSIFPFHGSTVTGMSLELFVRNIIKVPQTFISAFKMIRKHKPDLLHLNSSSLFVVAMAAKFVNRNIKIVCHVREPLLKHSISAFIIRYMNYFFVDHFIAIDHFSGNSMKTKNNISVIYNAVNFKDYNPGINSKIIRNEFNLTENDVVFLYLARIAKCNGVLQLVKVANKLTKYYPQFHFVLAGFKEVSLNKYEKEVLSNITSNANIHTMKFRNEVPLLIAGSDIVVVPFTEPHFARSIVEASAMARPIIGANVGGVNELINAETGLLYNTEQELYDYCVKLGTDKSLQAKLGNGALGFAKKNFDNNISSNGVFDIYNTLLNIK